MQNVHKTETRIMISVTGLGKGATLLYYRPPAPLEDVGGVGYQKGEEWWYYYLQ